MKWTVQLYFPLIDILEKADYRLMLLKIEKGFPQINFIKLQQQQQQQFFNLKRVTHLAYNNYSSMWPSEESCKRY